MRFNLCSKCGSGAINLRLYNRDDQRIDLCDTHYWQWRHDQATDEIAIYKDALERLSRLGNGDYLGNSDGNVIAQAALTHAKEAVK